MSQYSFKFDPGSRVVVLSTKELAEVRGIYVDSGAAQYRIRNERTGTEEYRYESELSPAE